MDPTAGVARFLKEGPYAKAVQFRFHEHCEETSKLDALSRCRALNHLLESEVRLFWTDSQTSSHMFNIFYMAYRAYGNFLMSMWRQRNQAILMVASQCAKYQETVSRELMGMCQEDISMAVVRAFGRRPRPLI